MKIKIMNIIYVLFVSLFANTVVADHENNTDDIGYNIIDIAGYDVPVVAGGLYDRYRSNPPLSVIADEAPGIDLSWIEGIEKVKMDIGFESYSPNFFYENSKITAIYTADIDRLRELMPTELLDHIQPLELFPGRGVVALTAYAYHYCDNDYYNEFSLSIATNKPGKKNMGLISLVHQLLTNDYWGYILKLPVDSELARVRGVIGYNLPKWLTDITYEETSQAIRFEIYDETTGEIDVIFQGSILDTSTNSSNIVKNSFSNINQAGVLQYGYTDTRNQSHATSMKGSNVSLILSNGSLSEYIRALDLGLMIRYEYVPEFQSALYAPELLNNLTNN
ncbi:MAG: acetoacetate decarboxylase family protein [Pseudomonadales bacterium]|nr:acetoacetate decarboxylase family protein [Pseudomonadales bacterium]